ncbi:hypothetical protein A3A54_00440 [Candidatus Curtissbacteria bacterium RIFCSPLOWO2_01_FULL_39_62]|uniref:Transglutaminase-like domain-containing protein n=2 Tax=Candidatus Curtissiibacteriota TaxID=1752717 RepID=A0A1F5GCC5_9BACT|nr:MAG: hypothetical protein A2775_02030 [Candidatus Curtissbacteria bacterium RIFCSPHIGHO2_01_FULL_39_57]OGD89508.1 MAG: hypothetical protein A3D04_00330 [Candidatus Curtissbacteria bacterium RIFCSPHIGHO2_02_FULL_40_16b]OGD90731.1 MAG: hypothetical protein A3E11_01905 [Candidatus Curtissbacteria bacterium RIFCSPHIGHO2_12_FULL_38_37]OGD99389.1 MAG: hypothetical protein A3J17_02480 [Candidatus Curtissbacteria bacterium RIFCSPLOWO2_02_FULL_40_11]OGE01502.1 MAG: hypothetical protein A3A54_00440 [C
MRILARAIFLILFMVYGLWFMVPAAHAEGEFETDYSVNYSINGEGKTSVKQDIVLKNKTPNFYADRFELKIGSTQVSDVTASDNTGVLETEIKFEDNLTTIGVVFNQKVIGTGKTLQWTLTYTSSELATKNGQIWEVSIPRLARSTDIGKYDAQVVVPRTFGPKAFAVPTPQDEITTSKSQTYLFNKDQLLESGIAMSFGEKQVFSFKLNYFLENNNVTSQIKEITLPPDNNYQQIVLEKLEPEPLDVIVDDDDNFIARYKLPARGSLDIVAEGFVEVFHKPFRKINAELTTEEKSSYVQPQRYWETDNGFIKDKANELKTAEKIYEFVVNFLSYNQDRLNQPNIFRKGAQAAIDSPQDAVCMEFTDLFIAIARAAGIPAREVTGFAYTQNERLRPLSLALNEGDILHAWPQYWDDEKGWVQIDPTWGSTSGGLDFFNKLDFNHITFTQRGKSSTNPVPPGAFKRSAQTSQKTVFVEFAQDLPQATINPELSFDAPQKALSGIPTKVGASVKNSGSTTIYNQNLALATSILKSSGESNYEIKMLPPFAKRVFDFRLTNGNLLLKGNDTLVLSYAGSEISKPISIRPFYNLFFSGTFLVSIVSVFIIIFIGFLFYKKLRKKGKIGLPLTKSS